MKVYDITDCDMHLELQEDYDKFCRILLKTDFENYSTELYNKLYWIRNGKVEMPFEEYRKVALKFLQSRLDLAETLLMFKQGKGNFIISSAKTSKKLPDELIGKMEELIEQQYKEWNLDTTPVTEVEREEYEKAHEEEDEEAAGYDEKEQRDLEEEGDEDGQVHPTFTDMIMSICEAGYEYQRNWRIGLLNRKRDITIEQINYTIKELGDEMKIYSKKGAPVKNEKLIAAVLLFSELKEKLSNRDFRTIYECCDHFGLIDELVKVGWHESNKYPEISYIASIHKNIPSLVENKNRKWGRVIFDTGK